MEIVCVDKKFCKRTYKYQTTNVRWRNSD
jgi:hypothetical protein